jgi:hypothetical protein
VLLSGGLGAAGAPDFEALAASEIFDPVSETFSSVGGLEIPRVGHSALLLPGQTNPSLGPTKGPFRPAVDKGPLHKPLKPPWLAAPET